MNNDFNLLYESRIRNLLIQTETERKKLLLANLFRISIPLLIVLVELIIVNIFVADRSNKFEGVIAYVFTFIFVASLSTLIYFISKSKEITRAFIVYFKRKVISPMIRSINSSLEYFPERSFTLNEILGSKLFYFNKWSGEDYVSGVIGETKIDFCELHLRSETTSHDDEKTKTKVETTFRGVFFKADFNKDFSGETVIGRDRRDTTILGKIVASIYTGKNTVKLEDPEFEKEFDVKSTDQVEARYILSPALMQRLVSFKREHQLNITLSFIKSNIFIAIPIKKDLFEPKIISSNVNPQMMKYYFEVLQMLIDIVDDLNLNTRIWSK